MRFVLVFLAVLMLTGCGGETLEKSVYSNTQENGVAEPLDPSMEMETEVPAGSVVMTTEFPEYPVGTEEIKLCFSTDVRGAFISYSEYWNMEVYKSGKWYAIPFKPNETVHDLGYILGEQWEYYEGHATMIHELTRLDYDFHPGRYRILKEFGGTMYAAEFEMVED